jgi:hypothetical protein
MAFDALRTHISLVTLLSLAALLKVFFLCSFMTIRGRLREAAESGERYLSCMRLSARCDSLVEGKVQSVLKTAEVATQDSAVGLLGQIRHLGFNMLLKALHFVCQRAGSLGVSLIARLLVAVTPIPC